MLKTVGRTMNDGEWYDMRVTPTGCSFNLPLIFDSLHWADVRCGLEEEADPSWNYFIDFYDR